MCGVFVLSLPGLCRKSADSYALRIVTDGRGGKSAHFCSMHGGMGMAMAIGER